MGKPSTSTKNGAASLRGAKDADKNGAPQPSVLDVLRERHKLQTAGEKYVEQRGYRAYSTGSLLLDIAIGERDPVKGNYGIPERAIVEIFGRNSSLKSAVSEHLMRSVLNDDPNNWVVCLFTEEPDLDRMASLGIDMSRVLSLDCYKQRELTLQTAEHNMDIAIQAVADPNVRLVIWDSIKATCSVRQLFTDNGKLRELDNLEALGIRAKLADSFILRFKQVNRNAILFMTNQISDRIALPNGQGFYTNPQYTYQTPGGRGKEFEANLRIESVTRPLETKAKHSLTDREVLYGWEASFRLIKNKYQRRTGNRVAITQFLFDPVGFNTAKEVLDLSVHLGLIKKSAPAYFKLDGEVIANKLERAILYLRDNPAIVDRLIQDIMDRAEGVFGLPEDVIDTEADLEEALSG